MILSHSLVLQHNLNLSLNLSKYCDRDIRILDLSQMIEQKTQPTAFQSASDPILWDYNHGGP